MTINTCSVDECNSPQKYRGWCGIHYDRWLRHGDPLIVLRKISRKTEPVEDRFWDKIEKVGECWIWPMPDGNFSYNGKKQAAARYSYELLIGPLTRKEFLFHTCNNKLCVNPQHLKVNKCSHPILVYCARGHERSGDNILVDGKSGKRHCRKCRQIVEKRRVRTRKERVSSL